MTEEERKTTFLSLFKSLEQKRLSLVKSSGEGHVSFSKALNCVYYQHLDPIVSVWENYDFLRTASDLRNILSHENDVCAPSENFLLRFQSLASSIIKPLLAKDIRTKNRFSCQKEDKVKDLIPIRDKRLLSHLPLLDSFGVCEGVFSRSTFFDYLSIGGNPSSFLERKRTDRMPIIGLYGHKNERFYFVPRKESASSLFGLFGKTKAHDKQRSLLFVTKNGRKDEKVLGVISLTDLLKQR